MTCRALLVLFAALPMPEAAGVQQAEGRSFSVTAIPDTAQVGDTVRLRFRLVLNERDLLTDTVPRPVAELPGGVRIHSVERLRRGPDRVFSGGAVLAFYRPGAREVPAFGVPWVQIVTGARGMVVTEPASVEIVPVLPAGNTALRDIIDPEITRRPVFLITLLGLTLAGWLVLYLLRRRRTSLTESVPTPPAVSPPPPPDPYAVALQRLDRIELDRWAERGEVERHYEATADVLRDYLEAAEEIPARERTSTELLWALPPRLMAGGLRRLTAGVLGDADLVKFARRRPGAGAAAEHLRDARELLARWHEAAAEASEEIDAVR